MFKKKRTKLKKFLSKPSYNSLNMDAGVLTPLEGFISLWNVSSSITLPYIPNGNFTGKIFWGDGEVSDNSYINRTHDYKKPGIYQIRIEGEIDGWSFFNVFSPSNNNLLEILQWGKIKPYNGMFYDCNNLNCENVSDVPNFKGVSNLNRMFAFCQNLNTVNKIDEWNVSDVSEMRLVFQDSKFNGDISTWNVSKVTDMTGMFINAVNFNQDLSGWCVSLITIKPAGFDTGANSWIGGDSTRPQWGYCP